jgi:hypothetical protein
MHCCGVRHVFAKAYLRFGNTVAISQSRLCINNPLTCRISSMAPPNSSMNKIWGHCADKTVPSLTKC